MAQQRKVYKLLTICHETVHEYLTKKQQKQNVKVTGQHYYLTITIGIWHFKNKQETPQCDEKQVFNDSTKY